MRIALPSRSIFDRLCTGQVGDHTIIRAPQAECEMLLRTARAELALISPLGYGSAPSLSDYHVVGTTCLVATENTALASIRFRRGLHEPRTYFAPEPDDFLTTIGLLLLAEQHELRLKPSATLDGADTVIAWNDAGDFPEHPAAIDLTEEWALACECSLPIGVWVCRSDLAEEFDVPSITTALSGCNDSRSRCPPCPCRSSLHAHVPRCNCCRDPQRTNAHHTGAAVETHRTDCRAACA